MFEIIEGGVGTGKSMECAARIVDELQHTNRFITTNMPLYPVDVLEKILVEKFGDTFEIRQRLRILTDEEVPEWYLHINPHVNITEKREVYKRGTEPVYHYDYSILKAPEPFEGTLFIIDEAGDYFDAIDAQKVEADMKYALRHQRKFTWDVLMCSQDRMQLAKQIRMFAQRTTVMRNLGLERIGLFRPPSVLYYQTFFRTPDVSQKPMNSGVRRIDRKFLGSLYDTSAGVGVSGGMRADTQDRKKGLPVGWMIAGIVVVCVLLAMMPTMLGWVVRRFQPRQEKMVEQSAPSSDVANAPVRHTGRVKKDLKDEMPASVVTNVVPALEMVGYVPDLKNGGFCVLLSDGTIATTSSGRVKFLNHDFALIDGRAIYKRLPVIKSYDPAPVSTTSAAPGIPTNPAQFTQPEVKQKMRLNYHGSVTEHTLIRSIPVASETPGETR